MSSQKFNHLSEMTMIATTLQSIYFPMT